MIVALISCSKVKLQQRSRARDLYASPLFRKSLRYAEAHYDATYVLSAKHGVLELDEYVDPYGVELSEFDAMDIAEWGQSCARRLRELHPEVESYAVLAGSVYLSAVRNGFASTSACAIELVNVLGGMQVGERLRWLNIENAKARR